MAITVSVRVKIKVGGLEGMFCGEVKEWRGWVAGLRGCGSRARSGVTVRREGVRARVVGGEVR